jgi:YVTN family beta-propeller protein
VTQHSHPIHANRTSVSRRGFLRKAGLLAPSLLAGTSAWAGEAFTAPASGQGASAGLATRTPPMGHVGSRRPLGLIANSLSNTLTVVDAHSLDPLATIPGGREPHKFHLSQNGRTVYSCNTTSNEMIEIDLTTLRTVRHISILDPYNVTFTRNGRHLFKLAYRFAFVEVHDAQTFRRMRRLETGSAPSHFALTPDGDWFINSNQHADTVTVIDTRAMVVAQRLKVDPFPAGIAVSHDGRFAFVASGNRGTISAFAIGEWKLAKRVYSGKDAHEMVMTRDGSRIFVTNRGENTMSVFDVGTQRVVERFRVPGGPDMPLLSPDEQQLWVSGRYGNITTVVDARTLRILTTFRTGRSPHGIFLTGSS